jgi:TRAP transporter TAXI family solute receptor
MEIKDVDWRPLTHTERVTGMQDKQLDMAGYATAWPAGSIIELSSARPVRILGFKDPAKDIPEFLKLYPAYGTETMKAGTYNGVDEDVQLITTGSVFAALPDLSADYVYNMLDCMIKGLDEVQAVHGMTKFITPENMVKMRGVVPWHAGAEKFFKDKGLIK